MTQTSSSLADFPKLPRRLRIVLAGGSGHVGSLLRRHFSSQGHLVRVLSRRRDVVDSSVAWWDGLNLGEWVVELDGADVVINLSGRSVDCRYTALHRWEIMESRVRSTEVLGDAIARLETAPLVWLNASTATIYRHEFVRDMDEISGEIGGAESNGSRSWNFSIDLGSWNAWHSQSSASQCNGDEPRARWCFRRTTPSRSIWTRRSDRRREAIHILGSRRRFCPCGRPHP